MSILTAAYNRRVNSSAPSLFRWPLPALLAWSGSWLLYGGLLRLAWPTWLAVSAATVAGVLLVSASLTALASGRIAVSGSAVRAVREDW